MWDVTSSLWTSRDMVSVITCLQVRSVRSELRKHYILCLGLLYHDMDNVLLLHRCITPWDRVTQVTCHIPRLISRLDVRTVTLLGHSMGGGLCQLFTAAFPELVDRS